ncbi:MAG: hypothetical protein AAF938_03050 [Myxococcota bacterium]
MSSSAQANLAPRSFLHLVREERTFIGLLLFGFLFIALTFENAFVAQWTGFAIAAYSVVANDSIQTLGTFIASNHKRPWWVLWAYIAGIFLVTMITGWWLHDGDVAFERLTGTEGFETQPTSFSYLQVAAPLFLMMLTRMRMPVSTSFLLLSCFATQPAGIGKVLTKSLLGYGVAFVAAIAVWMVVAKVLERYEKRGPAHRSWYVFQWITTGLLWSVWLQQDAANVAVFLPRQLSVYELIAFCGIITLGLGLLFRAGGERVQAVVDEKSSVHDVRAATAVDFIYAVILYIFKIESKIPMSTTWVFIGLLAGRELAMSLRKTSGRGRGAAFALIRKDLTYVTIGLIVSLTLAFAVNENFRNALLAGD